MSASDSKNPAVSCAALVKHYGQVTAVNGLDFEVAMGECFGLLGPNGAGKTTTVEILEGLLLPTSGTVKLLGKSWDTDERYLRERVGVSLQETNLPDKLTVRETVELFRSFYPRGYEVEDTINLVALGEKENAKNETLSGGQRQRLGLACALVSDPALLFLDEPTTGLDPQARRSLWEVVQAFKEDGASVLLTTHYMDEAERLCDRIGVVDHGKMIATGTPKELIATLGGQQIIDLTIEDHPEKKLDLEVIAKIGGVHSAKLHTGVVSLAVDQLHTVLPAILAHLGAAGLTLTNLSTHHATLEDVFVNLTGRQLRE
jgi:ABC-2 type transport system ATP-binding protein